MMIGSSLRELKVEAGSTELVQVGAHVGFLSEIHAIHAQDCDERCGRLATNA